jgi:MFS family permease
MTRRFGTFWVASLLSNVGTWAQQVAEPWLLLTIGASPFLIGLDSFAMNAPVWLLTLVGGMLADRNDRRRVIALFQTIQMLCPTLIAILLVAGAIRPSTIIALSLVVGVTDALSMPSFQSIAPSIVAREQIGRALALNSTQFNLSRVLGPAIAGMLMTSVGAVGCFALSALSYIPFIGVALWILPRRAPKPHAHDEFGGVHLLSDLRTIADESALRGALLTVFTGIIYLTPLGASNRAILI